MKALSIALVLGLAAPASAQVIAIHGHPEKAAYASPAEWVTDSAQCHWNLSNPDQSIFMPATANTIAVPHSLGHVHVDFTHPRDGEITGPVVLPFAVKLFHTAGRVTGFYKDHVRDLVFDETGTSDMPVMIGDPMGLKVWTGHLTLDLGMEQPPYAVVKHGWASADLVAVTDLDNADHGEARLLAQYWSMLDPSVPVPDYNPRVYGSRCDVQGAQREVNHFGSTSVQFSTNLPLAPLVEPLTGIVMATSGYGAANDPTLPDVIVQQRVDLDLHNRVPGRVLFSKTGRQNQGGVLTLDPAMFTVGKHKMAGIRDQPDAPNEVAALLVTDFEVAAGVPPPPPPPVDVCSNIEGVQTVPPVGLVAIDGACVPPPPPVVPLLLSGTYRLCDASGKCVDLVVK